MIEERRISSIDQVKDLIHSCGLSVNENVDYTVGIFDGDELVATGSLFEDMIQMVAVSQSHHGEDLLSMIITHLINHALKMKKTALYLFTKPENINMFVPLGFNVVAVAKPYAALLEWGHPGIEDYCRNIRKYRGKSDDNVSAIVMNCNPFTLGHRYLIETAASQSKKVFVLVVQEDLSIFPFDVRFKLICQGTAHLPNVTVIPGGRYVISSLTFPSYFTKVSELTAAQCAMDAEIFARHIAPALGIKKRFVGTEPFSQVTEIYNKVLKQRLGSYGIEVVQVPRIEKLGMAVSASRVRQLLAQNDIEAAKELIPETTYDYLTSEAAVPTLRKLKKE